MPGMPKLAPSEPRESDTDTPTNLTAALFVGGESRRMGRDKAALLWQGRPLWTHQLDTLRALNPATLWISARVPPTWRPDGVEVVLDDPPAHGPVGGLAAVLGRLRTSHLLALAVDLPRIPSEHLLKLWSLATPGCGVIPERERGLEPLCAFYPTEAAPLAAEAVLAPAFSLRALARRLLQRGLLRVYALSEAESSLYHNLNTPEDLPSP
jgi:molybdopterin-guanine dinucleotide biosynthesis protein A